MVNLAYYEEKDYDYFLTIVDDREKMCNTWDEWFRTYLKTKHFLISEGFLVRDVVIDLNELMEYCAKRKIKNNSEARAQFVANKK